MHRFRPAACNAGWLDDYGGSYAEFNAALRESYLKLVDAGDTQVFYVFGKHLLANDTYALDADTPTAAGCHPTDLGHYRMARCFIMDPLVFNNLLVN